VDLETDVLFQTEKDMERTKLVEEMNSGTAKKITLVSEEKIAEDEPFDVEVFIDDI